MYHLVPGFIAANAAQKLYKGVFSASVIQCDLKNFSRLSDIAVKEDIEGVEIIAHFLKTVFAPAIEQIHSCGGFINVFQGDGFLAVIPEGPGCAADTLRIAKLLIHTVKNHQNNVTPAIDLPDAICLRLSFGAVEWQIFPSQGKYTWYLHGAPIIRVTNIFHDAAPNVLNCDSSFLEYCTTQSITLKVKSVYEYLEITSVNAHSSILRSEVPEHRPEPGICELFYPELAHLETINDEYRQIITVFVQLASPEQATESILLISKLALNYGGYLNKLDTQLNYLTVMLLWGAPRAVEKPAHKVSDFALQLKHHWHDKIRIGITTGVEFTGIIGNQTRSEYTAIGSSVNRAARLVHQARWGEILLCSTTNNMLGTDFHTKLIKDLTLQGFTTPQAAFVLLSRDTSGALPVFTGEFAGRINELKTVRNFIQKHLSRHNICTVRVEGLVGIGKSRFVYELMRQSGFHKVTRYYVKCDEVASQSFNPYYHFLIQLLSLQPSDSKSVMFTMLLQKLEAYRAVITDHKVLIELDSSLDVLVRFYDMFRDVSQPDLLSGFASSIDLPGIMAKWVIAEAMTKPVILFLDNVQWIDADTIAWVNIILSLSANLPVCVISSTRLNYPGQITDSVFPCDLSYVLDLDVLPFNYSDELLNARILEYDVPAELFNDKPDLKAKLLKLCAGNPLFTEQLVLYIKSLNGNAQKKLKSELSFTELPLNLNYTILARLDTLPVYAKDAIMLATVIGLEFPREVLDKAYRHFFAIQPFSCDMALRIAVEEHILFQIDDDTYKFSHSMFREIIYSSLTKRRLREYHDFIAHLLTAMPTLQSNETYYLNIAEHFKKADFLNEASQHYLLHARRIWMFGQTSVTLGFLEEIFQLQASLPQHDYNIICETALFKTRIYIDLYDKATADKCLRYVEEIKPLADYPGIQASYISIRAHALSAFGDIKPAIELIESFLSGYPDQSDKDLIGLYFSLGIQYSRLGNNQETKRYLNLVPWESPMLIAEDKFLYHHIMGSITMFQGDLNTACGYLAKAEEIAVKHHLNDRKIEVWGSLALCYQYQGLFEKAFEFYNQSLQLAEQYDDYRAIGTTYNNLGLLFMMQNRFTEALYYLKKCEHFTAHFDDPAFIQNVLLNVGLISCELGDFTQAEESLNKQLALAEQFNLKPSAALGKFFLALARKRQQHYMEALTLIDSALDLCRETETFFQESAMEVTKAEIMIAIGAVKETEPILRHVLDDALNHGRDDAWMDAQLLDARRICIMSNNLDEAAVANLIRLTSEVEDTEALALLHFELWNLSKLTGKAHAHLSHDPQHHHSEATRLFTELLGQVHKWEYIKRMEILELNK